MDGVALLQRAWLGRSDSCPQNFAPAGLVVEREVLAERDEWTVATPSSSTRRQAPQRGGGRSPVAAAPPSAPEEVFVYGRKGKNSGSQQHLPGDWFCPNCGDLQFARNVVCRCCGTPKAQADSAALARPVVSAARPKAVAAKSAAISAHQGHTADRERPNRKLEAQPAAAKVAPSSPVAASEGGDRRSTASPTAAEGAWQLVSGNSRSSWGPRRNRDAQTSERVPSAAEGDATRWSSMRNDVAPSDRDAAASLAKAPSGKDQPKWAAVQKGVQQSPVELVEEEDARTDTTSSGPGGEEATSGASTAELAAGKEQAQQGSEAEDTPADDGWTQVPARKKDRKEQPQKPAVDATIPKASSNAGKGAQAQRREGTSAWGRQAPPAARSAASNGTGVGRSVAGDGSKSVAPSKDAADEGEAGIVTEGADGSAIEAAEVAEPRVVEASPQSTRPAAGWSRSGSYGEATPKGLEAGPRKTTTVKYKVGIKQEEDFNLMRRLLVPGGGHIKRIAQATNAKLTVRGEGSGHLEGPNLKEATDEPLMICVVSAYPSSLAEARSEVEALLVTLHEEYRSHCHERELPVPKLTVSTGEVWP